MQVSEAMTPNVRIVGPDDAIGAAAATMAKIDAGALPVGENDRLVGVITDRDIAIRAVAAGKGPDTKVRDVMSKEVLYCFEDDEIDNAARNMAANKLRRLPVLDRNKRLVGILSLGDVAQNGNIAEAGDALADISKPGGKHSQSGGSGRRAL
jgi:CBS domain-containing protein